MKSNVSIIWLGPVFSYSVINANKAISPAASKWQSNLIRELSKSIDVTILSHVPDRYWPLGGKAFPKNKTTIKGEIFARQRVDLPYVNLPLLRCISLFVGYFAKLLKLVISKKERKVYIVTYNVYCWTRVVTLIKKINKNIKLVSLIADDSPSYTPDGYVFLSWSQYLKYKSSNSCLHLEGGIDKYLKNPIKNKRPEIKKTIFAYAGNFSVWTGYYKILETIPLVKSRKVEFWFFGKGDSSALDSLSDDRVVFFGYVTDEELMNKLACVDVFLNIRPTDLEENKKNFPSKLLEYLSFNKIVISTWTDGIPPEYKDKLLIIEDETSKNLANIIDGLTENKSWMKNDSLTLDFLKSKTWSAQSDRFINFLFSL